MAKLAYLLALQGFEYKSFVQQIRECAGILFVLLEEKKKDNFKDKYA